MKLTRVLASLAVIPAVALILGSEGKAQTTQDVPAVRPAAIIDLSTREGTRLVRGEWRFSEVQVIEVDHHSPGPDLKPSGPPNRTYDITPHAGGADFDDGAWEVIEPTTLEMRRSTGRLCFAWYRIKITVPELVGPFDPAGSSVVFEIVVDDYAEIWANGQLPVVLGQTGGAMVKGFNAPNRLLLSRDAQPGDEFQLAIFTMNGPMSQPPGNFIWIRSATLEFYPPGELGGARLVEAVIDRRDPGLDAIVPLDAKVERIANGFQFTEGPVWVPAGYLLFSDPNANNIYRWAPDGQVTIYRTKSGYTGLDIGRYHQPGSNGLALDGEGRLTIAEHGNRRVTRLERNGVLTVLADNYEGKRLNSPNDLVYRSDGSLYFTDPPFGLPGVYDDPAKELPYSGVFLLRDGKLRLVSRELLGPNGLAFSPDEKYLYVGNWDPARKIVMRYEVRSDGTLANGEVFFDMGGVPGEEAIDGVKVDRLGNLFVSGPGGVWVISPTGKHLGTIRPPELPANFAFGDSDGRSLYMTARTGLYRLRLSVPGSGPWAARD